MARILRLICHVVLWFLSFDSFALLSGAQSDLQLGITSYENAAYKEAVRHPERAVSLDPASTTAHLYLADAYNEMYCETCEFDSGQDSDINDHWRVLAIFEYKKVLELDMSSTAAMNSLAHLYYWHADLDEAERYYRRTIEVDPSNSEALYTLAVIDWQRSYRVRMQKRIELKLSQKQRLTGFSACAEIRAENLARIDESIVLLTKALRVLDAGEAMGYMAIFYRERADIQCGDRPAYRADLKTSVQWEDRACGIWHNPDRARVPSRWPAPPPPPSPRDASSCPF